MSSEPEDEVQASRRSRFPLLVILVVVLVAAFFGGRELSRYIGGARTASRAPAIAEAPAANPTPPAAVTAPPPAAAEPTRDAKPRAARKAAPAAPVAPTAPAAPKAGELTIESDVPGAMVFLDRVYLGTAPVVARDVAPGSHHLNASAEGYDGYSETIEVSAGQAIVNVRFKEIRLKEALDVVHRHGMGSCEGRLLADPQGVRYETANKDDAFSLKFADIEVFEVDYLKKNLRLKRKSGKTWNFTTRTENADPLFVFHRNVNKVRQQLLAR